LVNRAAIVRDGLLTGTADWPAAVKMYEHAAELGNVVGAFNAGNVSDWLAHEGVDGYVEKSAKWFRRAIEIVEAGPINESHTSPENAQEMAESAKRAIAHMVLEGQISAENDPMLARIASEHEATCTRAGHGGRVIRFTDRVKESTGDAAPTPAGNWLRALKLLGWDFRETRIERSVFEDPTKGRTVRLESVLFPGKARKPGVRLLVVWDACLPIDDGFRRIESAVEHARQTDKGNYLLAVGRKALVKEQGGFEFTPAWLAKPGETKVQILSISGKSTCPMDLVEQIDRGRAFGSWNGDASLNYEFAIAVNTLDAGVSAAVTWDAGTVRWVGAGGVDLTEWRMPYYDAFELVALGFAPDVESVKGA
jgi:hypothetical protein